MFEILHHPSSHLNFHHSICAGWKGEIRWTPSSHCLVKRCKTENETKGQTTDERSLITLLAALDTFECFGTLSDIFKPVQTCLKAFTGAYRSLRIFWRSLGYVKRVRSFLYAFEGLRTNKWKKRTNGRHWTMKLKSEDRQRKNQQSDVVDGCLFSVAAAKSLGCFGPSIQRNMQTPSFQTSSAVLSTFNSGSL